MKIQTALILCAGYGKRLNPLTLKKPKPLLEINKVTLLENAIQLLEKLEIQKIKLNTFYLGNEIKDFILRKKFKSSIEIIEDGMEILGTGGGINNLIKSSQDEDFIVLNPDTIWDFNYLDIIKEMEKYYFEKKIQNLLMVVNKNKSFDKRFKSDFELKLNQLSKGKVNNFIYTGCQLINKNLFKDIMDSSFSISKIWNELLKERKLHGYESLNKFVHITDLEIFNKLIEN